MMKPWVKAGIVGGILQAIFTLPVILIYLLPLGVGSVVALCVCSFFLLLYPVPGILGAHWLSLPRTTKQGAVTGALAGLLATAIDSIATLLIVLGSSVTGLTDRYIAQNVPNFEEIMRETGTEFWFSTGGQLLQTAITIPFHILTGVILSALAGMIYIAIKKE
jgi:hypothetical protein